MALSANFSDPAPGKTKRGARGYLLTLFMVRMQRVHIMTRRGTPSTSTTTFWMLGDHWRLVRRLE